MEKVCGPEKGSAHAIQVIFCDVKLKEKGGREISSSPKVNATILRINFSLPACTSGGAFMNIAFFLEGWMS